ncbi:MAG: precorrin-6Y C5,15-methyltransferase (decarboxylating) subunit CbiT [Firmicutes bacterium HGW-Firmicutes-13]|nr:MAG: precorrin-6Y C5,15-methyltransferase (decarboxylating) subunit CbiT [Firmicutes bacterium HGW-Firmicutes-13]
MSDKIWPYCTPGIADEDFVQGNTPLTKEEVRVVLLSKTRIREEHVIYDIGAGSGSISVEAAILAKKGMVYAVEQDPVALKLIYKNKERFRTGNMTVIKGCAPEVLNILPPADRIIIGGSGGKLPEILAVCEEKLKEKGILTVTAVTMNTLGTAQGLLDEPPWENLNIVQVAVTRAVKAEKFRILKALNPVFILTAERGRTE